MTGPTQTHYHPFPTFAEWTKTPAPLEPIKTLERVRDDLNQSTAEVRTRAMVLVRNVAAVETGAIEDLYPTDRGVTISAASQIAILEFIGRKQGEKIRSYVSSQMEAYELVLDFATKSRPVSSTWIRELHATVCRSQDTYQALVGDHYEERPLHKGQFKTQANMVVEQGGNVHIYAPPESVPPEIQRLVDQISSPEFSAASPIEQASYTHYALVSVHPFDDGNGRVARAFASLFAYRAFSLPLLIYAIERDEYFAGLADADNGNFERFKRFIASSMLRAGRLMLQTYKSAALANSTEALGTATRMYYTSGGYLQVEVDAYAIKLLHQLFEVVQDRMGELQATLANDPRTGEALTMSCALMNGDAATQRTEHRRPIPAHDKRMISLVGKSAAPADASHNVTVAVSLPRDARADDVFVLEILNNSDSIEVPLQDYMAGRAFEAETLIGVFAERILSHFLQELTKKGQQSLVSKGFGP
jgi:Fic family protein